VSKTILFNQPIIQKFLRYKVAVEVVYVSIAFMITNIAKYAALQQQQYFFFLINFIQRVHYIKIVYY
jgi:hypothetical protein